MNKTIYKITINNWEKYNSSLKKGHKKILISTGFLTDAKIRMLPVGGKLLYLGLLLRCGEVTSNYVECSHDVLLMLAGGRGHVVTMLLDQLQTLQLLTYTKNDFFMNRIEKKESCGKLKEEKPIVGDDGKVLRQKKSGLSDIEREQNKKIWETYFTAYRKRYGVDPVRNGSVNGQVNQLRKRLGCDDACQVVEFYLHHNDSWFLKKTHSFGLCLKDAETLRTQAVRGVAITNTRVRDFEKKNAFAELMDDMERNIK